MIRCMKNRRNNIEFELVGLGSFSEGINKTK